MLLFCKFTKLIQLMNFQKIYVYVYKKLHNSTNNQSSYFALTGQTRGVFRTFELLVLTVIDCPKILGAKWR